MDFALWHPAVSSCFNNSGGLLNDKRLSVSMEVMWSNKQQAGCWTELERGGVQVGFNVELGGYFSIKRNARSIPGDTWLDVEEVAPYCKAILEVFRSVRFGQHAKVWFGTVPMIPYSAQHTAISFWLKCHPQHKTQCFCCYWCNCKGTLQVFRSVMIQSSAETRCSGLCECDRKGTLDAGWDRS